MPRAAASRSASSSTMHGSLPPSSSVIFFKPSAARAITFLPVGVDPVSAIFRMIGWSTMASPVAVPSTTLTTPSGRPPSISASMHARVESGVVLAGLRTTVLPAAIAGASLFAASVSGKFQGTIAPHTDRHANHKSVGGRVGESHMLAVDLVGEIGKPGDVLAETLLLVPGLEQRLALFFGEDGSDLLHLAEHVMRCLVKDLGPLGGSELRPGRKRLGGGLRCLVDVGRTAGRNHVDHFAGRGITDLVGLAGYGLRSLAFDNHRCHKVHTPLLL